MNGHQLMDLGALLCGILTATGCGGMALIFGLYAIEERLRQDETVTDPNNAQRSDWFSQQYEAWTPTDAAERAEYLAQLAREAADGPGAGQENLA